MPCLRAIRAASTSVANPEVSIYGTPDRSTETFAGFGRKALISAFRISPEFSTVIRP